MQMLQQIKNILVYTSLFNKTNLATSNSILNGVFYMFYKLTISVKIYFRNTSETAIIDNNNTHSTSTKIAYNHHIDWPKNNYFISISLVVVGNSVISLETRINFIVVVAPVVPFHSLILSTVN